MTPSHTPPPPHTTAEPDPKTQELIQTLTTALNINAMAVEALTLTFQNKLSPNQRTQILAALGIATHALMAAGTYVTQGDKS